MFISPVIAPWIDLSIKAGDLHETQALVGLRLFRMATGTVPLLPETQRMIPEKVAALADAQALVGRWGKRQNRAEGGRALSRTGQSQQGSAFQSPRISRQ